MKIRAITPNRIDLAGGTLDIHPLYLFAGEGLTVNLGIDIHSKVEIETRRDRRVVLRSKDLGKSVEVEDADHLELGHDLDLLARAVRFFRPTMGIEVTTENDAPKGSGLGASSALLMALFGALARLVGTKMPGDTIIDWGANLEAQNLGIPTGKQDYYGAVYGGLSAIHFGVKGGHREGIAIDRAFQAELEERLILTFTGISHFSGTNNWNMVKRYIDREGDTVERLHRIRDTASRMREALAAHDLDAAAAVLADEWENRKGLADGVSTPEIDRMVADAAAAGALSSKICGAGGGGCMITIAARGKREPVEVALQAAGATLLPFKVDLDGLQVEALETSKT